MRWLLKGVKIINFMKSNQTPNFNPKDIIRNITQLTENGLKQSKLASKGDDWHSVVDLLDESEVHRMKENVRVVAKKNMSKSNFYNAFIDIL